MTGIYIHFPFCIKKCAYCDFVSYENMLHEGERYVAALLLEMEEYRGEKADTVYLGGGTPTALSPELLQKVLNGVHSCFDVAPNAEITIEANPGTCDTKTFSALKGAGVNRVSLGVQSFVDEELRLLGRIHTAEDAEDAVSNIRDAGISNISLDLMFSLPSQTEESLRHSLEKALLLEPQHLSCYSLTLCENTPLETMVKNGVLTLPDEDTDRHFYRLITQTLENNGYKRYEISNFSLKDKEAKHNTKYWNRAPYIGLGAAAHSFFGDERFENPALLQDYYERAKHGKHPKGMRITKEEAMAEFVFLGLRKTKEGISRKAFYDYFQTDFNTLYGEIANKLTNLALLADDGERLLLTDRGIDISNAVLAEFL